MNLALAMVPYLTHGEVLSGSALSGSVPPYRLQGPGANYTPDDAHTVPLMLDVYRQKQALLILDHMSTGANRPPLSRHVSSYASFGGVMIWDKPAVCHPGFEAEIVGDLRAPVTGS
jgi:hypothetical protein